MINTFVYSMTRVIKGIQCRAEASSLRALLRVLIFFSASKPRTSLNHAEAV